MITKEPGDLFVFYKQMPPITDHIVFHVGLFVDEFDTVIHVTRAKGVIKETLSEAISDIKPTKIAIYRIQCSEEDRKKAIEFHNSVVGAAYNDIFSTNCVNSKNQKAFYCAQLIGEAFGNDIFPMTTISFLDKNGDFLRPWVKHFSELKIPIPEGQLGYRFRTLITFSEVLRLLQFFNIENGKMIEQKISSEIENKYRLESPEKLFAHL